MSFFLECRPPFPNLSRAANLIALGMTQNTQIASMSSQLWMLSKSEAKPTKSKKTITRSFRISEDSFAALEEEAAHRNVSVNTLVDQILEVHTSYERYIEKLGRMRMAKSTFRRVLEASPTDGVAESARLHMKEMGKVATIAKYGELNLTNLLDGLGLMMTYGGWGEFHETESNGKLVLTLMHNLGQNGSIYLSNFVKALFEVINLEPRITNTDQAVVVEIQE